MTITPEERPMYDHRQRDALILRARASIKASRAVIDLLDSPEGRSFLMGRLGPSGAGPDDVDNAYDTAAGLLAANVTPLDRRDTDWLAAAGASGETSVADLAAALERRPEGALWLVDGPVPSLGNMLSPAAAGLVWHRNADRRSALVLIIGDTANVPYLERPADLPRHVITAVVTLNADTALQGDSGQGTTRWALDVLRGHLLAGTHATT